MIKANPSLGELPGIGQINVAPSDRVDLPSTAVSTGRNTDSGAEIFKYKVTTGKFEGQIFEYYRGQTLSGTEKWLNIDSYPPLNNKQIANFNELASYRQKQAAAGTPVTDTRGNNGTVSLIEHNGIYYIGTNSENWAPSISQDMDTWANNIGFTQRSRSVLNPLRHAEAHSLKQLHDAGSVPKQLELYVDRIACPDCLQDLPRLANKMGVVELTIRLPDGRYSISTNGEPPNRSWIPEELNKINEGK